MFGGGMENYAEYYQKNIYGIWRQGETVAYECLGPDPKSDEDRKSPFEVIGGELVRISVSAEGKKSVFIVHVYRPDEKACLVYPDGSPFIVCMHPITSAEYALSKGYTMIVIESSSIASDDTKHKGAFSDSLMPVYYQQVIVLSAEIIF